MRQEALNERLTTAMDSLWTRITQEAGAKVGGTSQASALSEWNQEEEPVSGKQEEN